MANKKKIYNTSNGFWFQLTNVTKYICESPKIVFKSTYNYFFNSTKFTEYAKTNINFYADLFNWRNNKKRYTEELEALGTYKGYLEQTAMFTEIRNFNNLYLLADKEVKQTFLKNLQDKHTELNSRDILFFQEKKKEVLCCIESSITSLQLTIDTITQRLQDQKDSSEQRKQELSEILVEKTQQIQAVMSVERENHLQQLTTERAFFVSEKKTQEQQYDNLLQARDNLLFQLEEKIVVLENTNKEQLTKLAESEEKTLRLAHTSGNFDEKLKATQTANSRLKSKLDILTEKLDKVSRDYDNLQSLATNLEHDLNRKQQDYANYRQDTTAKEHDLYITLATLETNLKTAQEIQTNTNKEYHKEKTKREAEISTLKATLKRALIDKESTETVFQGSATRMKELRNENDELRSLKDTPALVVDCKKKLTNFFVVMDDVIPKYEEKAAELKTQWGLLKGAYVAYYDTKDTITSKEISIFQIRRDMKIMEESTTEQLTNIAMNYHLSKEQQQEQEVARMTLHKKLKTQYEAKINAITEEQKELNAKVKKLERVLNSLDKNIDNMVSQEFFEDIKVQYTLARKHFNELDKGLIAETLYYDNLKFQNMSISKRAEKLAPQSTVNTSKSVPVLTGKQQEIVDAIIAKKKPPYEIPKKTTVTLNNLTDQMSVNTLQKPVGLPESSSENKVELLQPPD